MNEVRLYSLRVHLFFFLYFVRSFFEDNRDCNVGNSSDGRQNLLFYPSLLTSQLRSALFWSFMVGGGICSARCECGNESVLTQNSDHAELALTLEKRDACARTDGRGTVAQSDIARYRTEPPQSTPRGASPLAEPCSGNLVERCAKQHVVSFSQSPTRS